ncbi:MFS transporter [Pseudohaliea rubra]|uniref:Bicyclomycin resistance protein n=1 Tax=Pseudohaliea rubra DSM 19751 TaxID=1265313 RepID=A0A095XVI1_9GAMM|nr:MFS transporter [Pseudohaliea rubra]KGE03681.1 Bicyclomycin resistance protein [Pseudohaliea rubra DSM 19751]
MPPAPPVETPPSQLRAVAATALLIACTLLGLAGTDLVLPAVPALPAALGGSAAQAQLVLATFAAGTGVGLVLFGEIGARHDNRPLLVLALVLYGASSLAAAAAPTLTALVLLRFLQGVAAACAAVVAPGMVRALFSPRGAMRAIGFIGSVESLAPALAPIIGVWLLQWGGWQASFLLTGVLALALAALVALAGHILPAVAARRSGHSYVVLLTNPVFHRYALSQGFALGSLLVYVFGMPVVLTGSLGGTLADFITMQLFGITTFIIAANVASRLVGRFGAEPVILGGSLLSLAGLLALLAYGVAGGRDMAVVIGLFLPFNAGFGLRGPPGFYCALQASGGDDARASALVLLFVMATTAGGTALAAPLVTRGLAPLAAVAFALGVVGILCLALLPRLPGAGTAEAGAGAGEGAR